MAKFILRRVLRKKGISGNGLARLLKRPFSNVAKYLSEDYNPTLATLTEIAKALKCRVRDLIDEGPK